MTYASFARGQRYAIRMYCLLNMNLKLRVQIIVNQSAKKTWDADAIGQSKKLSHLFDRNRLHDMRLLRQFSPIYIFNDNAKIVTHFKSRFILMD